ncbi:MAG: hypothetical protein NC408_07295 [Candidatus Gastranaerophilales bacterium]|nr:hypothetical protein [Candidatus Gastranaerophilales bacterium]MCM1072179.1 hypothetical protein [Bacteroides sp.]
MFVNKIGINNKNQQVFKGYQHEVDNVGRQVMRFNYPYNFNQDHYQVQFYNVKKNPQRATGYEVITDKPVGTYDLSENGVRVNLRDMADLRADEVFAYKIIQPGHQTLLDTGIQEDGLTIVTTRGTTPMVQGPGVLSMPDLHRPGAYYDSKTGKVIYDPERQKASEGIIRNFANAMGGSLAGYEYELDALKSESGPKILKDVKVLFSTPVAGGDNRSAFRYWNKNNMQIDSAMGSAENYANFMKKMFQHGKKFVYDGTFTSEGLEGIHFQYAVRWADKNPQTYYWFRMTGLKDAPLGYGVVPKHAENLRHKVINAPSIYNPETGKVETNPAYDSNKETLIQIYDGSQVTDEQAADLSKPIDTYKKLKSGTPLDINSHDDTVISYVFEVNPNEYTKRLETLRDFNKGNDTPIVQNSPEGTLLVAQFSNFKFIKKTDGGFVTWDANTDMVKMNYHISGYDEKILKSIVDRSQRDYEQKMTERGSYEVQDLALQAARYWTGKSKNIQTLYTAQTLQNAASKEAIDALIEKGALPQEASLSEDAIANTLEEYYRLAPKGIMEKDDVTVKALMSLPLDSLEFGENTVGILSTSFFSNRATSPETIGLSRFELMQKGEPHLVETYSENYMRMNNIYKNELKNFADQIIQKVNETSNEKLIDEEGKYTPYGEYVIELMGQDIAKYALLKAVGGENTEAWTFEDGTITYDYEKLKENTTIKSLGIRAHNPADEAAELRKIMEHGLRALSDKDVAFVAESISKRIAGTDVNSFRLAEAIVNKASLGLDWRLDAAKDVIDMDAVRNGDLTFDQAWDQVIDFWSKFVQAVKKENPHSYIVAEITDVEELMQSIFGDKVSLYGNRVDIGNKYKSVPEAMTQFYLQTGITSEAGYSYTFTDLLKVFSPDFVGGSTGNMAGFMNNFQNIINSRGVDFIRNLWTFADNHDKPSVMHGMALDIPLFNANMQTTDWAKEVAMRLLTNVDDNKSLPLEAKFFLHDSNYYRLASSKAAAMSKLMRDCVNESGISEERKQYLRKAIANLTNGNHLGEGPEFKLAFDGIKPISSIEGAVEEMLHTAGIDVSSETYYSIIQKAEEKIDWYFGDKNPQSKDNIDRIKLMLQGDSDTCNETDLSQYSLYTVLIAGAIRDAFYEAFDHNVDTDTANKLKRAQRDYVKQYNAAYIREKQTQLPFEEDSDISMKKNGYAAKDFETVIKMILAEAEYLASKDGKLQAGQYFEDHDAILADLFRRTTEPAVKKAVMYASFLSALPGIPTLFARDMLGALGFDEKAKNIYLQNRNAIPWSELEEGPLKEYRKEILDMFMEAIAIRTDGGEALNNGTPYRASTSNGDVPAIMMQDGYGNMSVSVFDATGVNTNNRAMPHQNDHGIDYIMLGAGLSLPIGLEFFNTNGKDKATYVISDLFDKEGKCIGRGLKVKEGSYIALNKDTLRNGVMVLKHTAKKLAFRGNSRQINKQYNIVSNPYKKVELPQEGQNLSIIAK